MGVFGAALLWVAHVDLVNVVHLVSLVCHEVAHHLVVVVVEHLLSVVNFALLLGAGR